MSEYEMSVREKDKRGGQEKSFHSKARFRSTADNLRSKFSVRRNGTKDFPSQAPENPSADVFTGPFSWKSFLLSVPLVLLPHLHFRDCFRERNVKK